MKAIGIDLGTTYSCVATVGPSGKPEVVLNSEGERTTPSAVWFDVNRVVVGDEAKGMAPIYPENVSTFIKREMGSESYRFTCSRGEFCPEQISAYILKKLVQGASDQLGEPITHAVITIPAYFADAERIATLNAAKIAGIEVLQIINEPTAAAIAYGMNSNPNSTPKHILVYDLGGGTFDVSIIRVTAEELRVICTDGDHHKGGKDWDDRLINILIDKFRMATSNMYDMTTDLALMQELQRMAERSKIALSTKGTITEALNFNGEKHRLSVTREEFELATRDLLEETLQLTRDVIEVAKGKGVLSIDELILVGGSTRMPQVTKALKENLGMEPKMFDPDEAVAKGAALVALSHILKNTAQDYKLIPQQKKGEPATPLSDFALPALAEKTGYSLGVIKNLTREFVNVCSKSYGAVYVVDKIGEVRKIFNIICRNTAVPAEGSSLGYTLYKNQENVRTTVMENNEPTDTPISLDEGTLLWEGMLKIQPGLPEDSPIETVFRLDENGILHVLSRDPASGNTIEADVQTGNSISKKELSEMRDRMDQDIVE